MAAVTFGAAELSAEDAQRARDLSRMRLIASGLLALMAALFIGASLGQGRWPGLAYLRAFAEAGMVGACADWFAVTALFRRPLGLPIPHTGLVPRNKDRIGRALGAFIAENFLTERVLEDKLKQLEVARWGGDWLHRPANARVLARRIAGVLPDLLAAMPKGAAGELVGAGALAAARAVPIGPVGARALGAIWQDGRAQGLVERGVEMLAAYVAQHEDMIRDKVAEHSFKWLPGFVDRMIAAKVSSGLIQLLQEMRDPEHPWRLELRRVVGDFITRLGSDPELQAKAEDLKVRLLADPGLQAQAGELWSSLESRLGAELAADSSQMAARLERMILALGAWLAQDEGAQARLNSWARILVRQVIAPRRQEIGLFVAQVVASWDAKSIVDKLELQVGRDLQYIRVNGTLVGGLVGLVIFTLARAFGLE